MLLFIKQGIRGDVSQISRRFASLNNLLTPNYDDKIEKHHPVSSCIGNKLYGW